MFEGIALTNRHLVSRQESSSTMSIHGTRLDLRLSDKDSGYVPSGQMPHG